MVVLRVSGDIVADMCDRLAELVPKIDPAIVARLEADAREAYGGGAVYVRQARQRVGLSREEMIARVQAASAPVAQQAKALGVSPRTLYRFKRFAKQRG